MRNLTACQGTGYERNGADVTGEGGQLGLSAKKGEVSPDACAV